MAYKVCYSKVIYRYCLVHPALVLIPQFSILPICLVHKLNVRYMNWRVSIPAVILPAVVEEKYSSKHNSGSVNHYNRNLCRNEVGGISLSECERSDNVADAKTYK